MSITNFKNTFDNIEKCKNVGNALSETDEVLSMVATEFYNLSEICKTPTGKAVAAIIAKAIDGVTPVAVRKVRELYRSTHYWELYDQNKRLQDI